ncbi:glycine cleavage system protein T [Thiohalorhabdus denitrificans]|uniref:Aminomethyltransferase n=1 Tax=Thiohalorhabdus denitrificans TaxID=381306 RepID=A0A0P9CKN2_9GAMM|nr:glycine cleavage system aminomethyltransferase GcvT [Thiohalorhabdus denitrificans]KPV39521.1 glycine cleavage system protein T [Thiohalorhabdus denitrificans]SCX99903.1 aminomethyltransferase [Thiohalorhabdus denitrificans]
MGLRTPLYDTHVSSGAKMVPFGDWDMPLHYGSQVEEHHAVRQACGIFDVSHMLVVDLTGNEARPFLRRLLANDVAKLDDGEGRALYTCMCTADGGVIDDLIVYAMREDWFRMVVNSSRRETDTDWIRARRDEAYPGVEITERHDLSLLAVQGPRAEEILPPLLGTAAAESVNALKGFQAAVVDSELGELFVGKTGYTGESGYEIALPDDDTVAFWNAVVEAGARPAGLGARDTLRLEAGLNLYGNDMDETTTPLEAGLAWTVAWEPADRDFIGRAALERQRSEGPQRKLIGLVLEGKGVLRSHQEVHFDGLEEVGEITSGTFSPTLERGIALVRVPAAAAEPGRAAKVVVRSRELPAKLVRPPFVKAGQANFEI